MALIVKLFAPEPVGEMWRCRFEVAGAAVRRDEALGIDSLQALQMAFEGVRLLVRSTGLKLRWCGEPGHLGLPMSVTIAWGLTIQRSLERTLRREERRLVDEAIKKKRARQNRRKPGK
jgi:hypothetical protein